MALSLALRQRVKTDNVDRVIYAEEQHVDSYTARTRSVICALDAMIEYSGQYLRHKAMLRASV